MLGNATLALAALIVGSQAIEARGASATPRNAAPAPNIVLISIDTLRADRLSAYGNPRKTSPNLDELARDGILFEQAVSPSPKTATSHMSLFTGLYPAAHGVMNWTDQADAAPLDPRIPTLAKLFASAGYHTAAYAGGINLRGNLGFDQGFEVFETHVDARRAFEAAGAALDGFERASHAAPARPFFLFVHTYQVHDPYLPPPEYARLFIDPAYAGRIVYSRQALLAAAAADGRDSPPVYQEFWSRVDRQSAGDLQHLLDLYDANIKYVDDLVGRLLERMRQLGLYQEAMVVVLSDHGEEFREHGAFLHNSVHQEVLHVPLVLRLPAGTQHRLPGHRLRSVVPLMDLMPTLLELAGLRPPPEIHGRSLAPLLEGRAGDRPAFSHWLDKGLMSLRDGNWKYVRDPIQERLYDLAGDPLEQKTVAAAHRDVVKAMRAEVDKILAVSAAYRRHLGPPLKVRPDEQTLEDLRALGYIDSQP